MSLLMPLDLKFVRDHLCIHLPWSPVPNAAEYLIDITFETTLQHQSYLVVAKSLTISAFKHERCTAQVTAINGIRQSEPSFILTIEPLPKLFSFVSLYNMCLDDDFSIECGPKRGYVTLKWSDIPYSCQYKIQRTDMNCTSIDNECTTIIGKNQTSTYEDRTKCDSANVCCMGHYYTVSILNASCEILTTISSKKVFCISSSMVKEVIPLQTTVSPEPPSTSVKNSFTSVFYQVKNWLKYLYSRWRI